MENLATGNMFLGRESWTTKYLYTPGGILLPSTSSYRETKKKRLGGKRNQGSKHFIADEALAQKKKKESKPTHLKTI